MKIYIKIGTGSATWMHLCKKRKLPVLKEIIKVKEKNKSYIKKEDIMKYYVFQKYYDTGKTEAEIKLESEIDPDTKEGYVKKETYDEYIDIFQTYEEAEQWRIDTINAYRIDDM